MGHRHTPEEHPSARRLCSAPIGASARPARRHEAAPVTHNDTSTSFCSGRLLRPAALVVADTAGGESVSSERISHENTCPEINAPAATAAVAPHSVAVRGALFALRFYKAYLSMLMAGSCRYQPTCSQFTYEAIARFGVLRGSWLGFLRLLRCQPFSRRFGFDPVPDEWLVRSADLSNHKEALS